MNGFIHYQSYFSKYIDKPGERYYTFKVALNLFLQLGGTNIVETGCVRNKDDWGAGNSTVLFHEFISKYGGFLWSIDISEENLKLSAELTGINHNNRIFINSDSVQALKEFDKPIDLLFLDSLDFPDGEMTKIYSKEKDYNEAMNYLMGLSERDVLNKHGDLLEPCQKHCFDELLAAQHCLHDKTIILLDDNRLPGGGKPRLAKEWLTNNNYICLLDEKQSLWIKKAFL